MPTRWVPLAEINPAKLRIDQWIRLVVREGHPTRGPTGPAGPAEFSVFDVEQGCEGLPEGEGPFWWMIQLDDPEGITAPLLTMFLDGVGWRFVLTDEMLGIELLQFLRLTPFPLGDLFGWTGLLQPGAEGIQVHLTVPCTPGHDRVLPAEDDTADGWEGVLWVDFARAGEFPPEQDVRIYLKQDLIGNEPPIIHLGGFVFDVEVEVEGDEGEAEGPFPGNLE